MATPNVGILTTTGKALIDKVNSGQAKISFSKVVFSSMDNSQLSDTQIKALTAIAPQEVVVSSPQTTLDTNSGETRIRATGTNEKLADGVYVKTYGVFAKDDTGNEILYGVTVSPNPNYFPAYDGVTPQAVTYSYKTVIQETSNITMTNSNDVYVSQEDLTEAIAKIPQPDLSGYDKTDDVDKKLQNKQDKLGFTAASDSTVVHTADMRKPASDVAGIEEVNAKQDKIGYTPADDSKVLHSSIIAQPSGTDLNTMKTAGFFRILNGLNTAPNSDNWTIYQVIPLSWNNGVQIAYGTNNSMSARRSWHAAGGIVFSSWVQSSDDSKVAHLSGANNFDTVPTVNNNPLLLASSLPSDLARTSQQTNFTAGLKSGGVDVATAADLNNYYHANASDDAALSAAQAANVPG
ncbi:pyocin knob domain-containing protein, partial [Levilactobacillus brevis]|uniref:pyocin knob domain-containing protein n=1 Tax=Levilactobacillus brevis TaxID=1580 RepID=UPI001F3B5F51